MKREIFCPPCAAEMRKQFPVEQPYPGEHVKFVYGFAKSPFRCDHCYAQIAIGDACTAFTIWTDAQGFAAWESDYVAPTRPGGDGSSGVPKKG